MSVTRDLQLDGYRGIVMIYIVCVIHVVNWLDYNIEPYNSFMLFEMPIIFFISGASLTFSGDKNFWQNLNNRLWRILVPNISDIYFFTFHFIQLYFLSVRNTYHQTCQETIHKNINNNKYDIFF